MKGAKTSYEEAVKYLYGLQKFGIKFGLSKTSNLLQAFGNPHVGQKYIHIAGTNGKGSVAAFLASILKEAGLKIGLYTSPHLVRFTERFRINNQEITHERAATLIGDLRSAIVPDEPPTFFEATTAIALLYFAQQDTDISIMEVGMGGRLDATNVIAPLVSVITNISMEHQFFLGSRLLDIAAEKGGIIKEGIDVVTGATQRRVISLLESMSREKRAAIWRLGRDIRYRITRSGFHYYGVRRRINGLRPCLNGKFQIRNAALALAVIERLEEKGLNISSRHIREGLKNTLWPGRMQVVDKDPIILLDGAHNPHAARALRDSIRQDYNYRRLVLVIGVMEDKDIVHLVRQIVPLSDYVIYTRPAYSRAARPEILMAAAADMGKAGHATPHLNDALEKAKEMADPRDLIVITGSLFTVGEALTYLDPKNYVQENV